MLKGASRRVMLTKLNITPMIDCVFLLNLFFMTVTELNRQDDIEAILLPDIRHATPDENPDPQRLVLNIWEDGTIMVSGNKCSDEDIMGLLLREARLSRNKEGISDRIILVKADEHTPFKHIKKLILMCVQRNIRIWRISFGIKPAKLENE